MYREHVKGDMYRETCKGSCISSDQCLVEVHYLNLKSTNIFLYL